MGLVNEVLPPDELEGRIETLARTLAANSPASLAATKALMAAQNKPWLDALLLWRWRPARRHGKRRTSVKECGISGEAEPVWKEWTALTD